jgi:hypothetical protein
MGTVNRENESLHPARQVHCASDTAPTGPDEWPGQGVHEVLPGSAANVPGSH